jgi:Domain of unknown function (DUF397)
MRESQWRKSSYSEGGGSDCVEVDFTAVVVGVRDSKNIDPQLAFAPTAWRQLMTSLASAQPGVQVSWRKSDPDCRTCR